MWSPSKHDNSLHSSSASRLLLLSWTFNFDFFHWNFFNFQLRWRLFFHWRWRGLGLKIWLWLKWRRLLLLVLQLRLGFALAGTFLGRRRAAHSSVTESGTEKLAGQRSTLMFLCSCEGSKKKGERKRRLCLQWRLFLSAPCRPDFLKSEEAPLNHTRYTNGHAYNPLYNHHNGMPVARSSERLAGSSFKLTMAVPIWPAVKKRQLMPMYRSSLFILTTGPLL